MKKLILQCHLSPGDIVMMTAAVRDLQRSYPGRFLTDVRTTCSDLWENNPYLVALDEADPEVQILECHYPLINRCTETPYHFVHGFIDFLNTQLDLSIQPSEFKGDIHISQVEKRWMSQIQELTGEDTPFWIVVAGGKYDLTVKWWAKERYQQVIDHFRGRIQFVQVGEAHHYHPKLEGVIDLRGQTDLRQLVRLVYHAQGVLCPVTSLMHLAAAVETKPVGPPNRPCVVIAGGREPVHWEAYPHHQFIHTIGALPCCSQGGCWRSRTVALDDGDERDQPENLCVEVVGQLPRCMDLISSAEVIRRIELYYQGGVLKYLTRAQAISAERAQTRRTVPVPAGPAVVAPGAPPMKAIRPRPDRWWHVFSEFTPSRAKDRQRFDFAKKTWHRQYASGGWQPLPIRDQDLPRLFPDRRRTLPFITDLVAQGLAKAADADAIVLTNADVCAAPSLTAQLAAKLEDCDACYAYRRDFEALDGFKTDEEVSWGARYDGVDLFAFRCGWWKQNAANFPDLLLGAERWDWCLRVLIARTHPHFNCGLPPVIYHQRHEATWQRPENLTTLPSQRHNRRLASQFLKQHGVEVAD